VGFARSWESPSAALLVGGSIVLAGILLIRAASWIDAAL
jgi:UPF0716 family protein affecting phage T7 exclusion